MREAADVRERDVGLVVQRGEHATDEPRMQEWHVGRRDEGHLGPVAHGGQAGSHPLQGSATLASILHHLDAVGQRGKVLPWRPDHDDGSVDRTGDDACNAAQQGRSVPLERGLGGPHPRGSTAGEDDTCGLRHTPRVVALSLLPWAW